MHVSIKWSPSALTFVCGRCPLFYFRQTAPLNIIHHDTSRTYCHHRWAAAVSFLLVFTPSHLQFFLFLSPPFLSSLTHSENVELPVSESGLAWSRTYILFDITIVDFKNFSIAEQFVLVNYFVVFCLTDYYLMPHISKCQKSVCPQKQLKPPASLFSRSGWCGGLLVVTPC